MDDTFTFIVRQCLYNIVSLQALYGSGGGGGGAEGADSDDDSTGQGSGKKTTTQEPPGTEGSDAELCTDTKVNALFNSAEGETFVFKGTYTTGIMYSNLLLGL